MTPSDDPQAESNRILKQVERETAAGGLFSSRMTERDKDASAGDDWIEQWGTRIGRTIGMVVAAALLAWIVLYALNLI